MSSKNSLPWDLEHAMTAFQVNPNWYDEYWLHDTNDLTGPQVRRRPDGSIDVDFYFGWAKRERLLAIKHAFFALLAMPIRFFRLAKAAHQRPMSALGQERTFYAPSHLATKNRAQKSGGPKSSVQPSCFASEQRRSLMSFRIRGLEAHQFDHLFALSDIELAAQGAVRRIADGPRPCRISLTDAKPGDELILVNYEHHAVASPYRMRFAIYIRRGEETFDAVGEVPEQLRKRTLAVRGFDASGMMTGWEIVEGTDVEAAIERQFANVAADYLHIHFAAPGCYAARVDRAG